MGNLSGIWAQDKVHEELEALKANARDTFHLLQTILIIHNTQVTNEGFNSVLQELQAWRQVQVRKETQLQRELEHAQRVNAQVFIALYGCLVSGFLLRCCPVEHRHDRLVNAVGACSA